MKAKLKKSMLGLATLGMVAAPIATTISCGKTDAIVILSGKTQIQKLGKQFAKTFDGMPEGKVEGAPSLTKFNTTNGDDFTTTLATSFGSKQFPSAMTIANASEAKQYIDKKALLKFKDPKYINGVATVKDAEAYNKKLAGDNINKLIKAVQGSDNPRFMVSGEYIVGIPTYTESIGVIYNTKIFKNKGIEKVVYGPHPTGANDSIFSGATAASIDTSGGKNTLYTQDLTSNNFKLLKKFFDGQTGYSSIGSVTSGKESWPFTSKVGMAATISWAAKLAGLTLGNVHMPGDTGVRNDLTPDSAKAKLFGAGASFSTAGVIGGTDNKGFEVYKDALDLYIKDSKSYGEKSDMTAAFIAGKLAMLPGGSWNDGSFITDGFKDYGMLPLSMKTDATNKPFISKDISGYWQFSNQEVANKRSGEKAIAAQKKAVNFVWAQYLSQEGKRVLKEDMGLLNPYDTTDGATPDVDKYKLLANTQEFKQFNGWGVSANRPGVGINGFERNNTEYTGLLDTYRERPTNANLVALLKKVQSIWNS